MKHTKEPWVGMVKGRFNSNHYWHADNDNSSCSTAAPIFAGGEVVCLAVSTDYEMQELEANAQRIVDCVNACSGMENPQAEITSLREQLEKAKKDSERYNRLRVLGCAVFGSNQLENGTVIRFQTLDEVVDLDLARHKSRGEAIDNAMKGKG